MIKIYLDDKRDTPPGFVRTYTVDETIELLIKHEGEIDTLSLDNDLGVDENNLPLEEGRMVARWLEEKAFNKEYKEIPNLFIHSDNNVAVLDMQKAFANARRYWSR